MNGLKLAQLLGQLCNFYAPAPVLLRRHCADALAGPRQPPPPDAPPTAPAAGRVPLYLRLTGCAGAALLALALAALANACFSKDWKGGGRLSRAGCCCSQQQAVQVRLRPRVDSAWGSGL